MATSQYAIAQENTSQDIFILNLYRNYRGKGKKLEQIAAIEEKQKAGQKITKEQEAKIALKKDLVAGVEEINATYTLYKKAQSDNEKRHKKEIEELKSAASKTVSQPVVQTEEKPKEP